MKVSTEEEAIPVSTGFLSPPTFQLSQIIHDERCFKPRRGHCSASGGGDILLFGGADKDDVPVNDFLRFIPGPNVFEAVTLRGTSPPPRKNATLVNWADPTTRRQVLLLFGGERGRDLFNDTYKYDPTAKSWQKIKPSFSDIPSERSCHCAVVQRQSMWIYGGRTNNGQICGDLWELRGSKLWEQEQSFTAGQDAPVGRTAASAVAWLHSARKVPLLIIFGGDVSGRGAAMQDLWMFNFFSKKWMEVKDAAGTPPLPRWAHSATIFDDRWMLISGGMTSGWFSNYSLSDFYAFDLGASCWFHVDVTITNPKSRADFGNLALVKSNKALYIFGGNDDNGTTADVYRLSPIVTFVSFSAIRSRMEVAENRMEVIEQFMDSHSQNAALNEKKDRSMAKVVTDPLQEVEIEEDDVSHLRRENMRLQSNVETLRESLVSVETRLLDMQRTVKDRLEMVESAVETLLDDAPSSGDEKNERGKIQIGQLNLTSEIENGESDSDDAMSNTIRNAK